MRVLVFGGRNYDNRASIRRELSQLPPGTTIVHGDCRRWDKERQQWVGADYLAGEVARALGFKVETHPANWAKFGPGAGPRRNEEMARANIDKAIGFPGGTGSNDMHVRCVKHGIDVRLVAE